MCAKPKTLQKLVRAALHRLATWTTHRLRFSIIHKIKEAKKKCIKWTEERTFQTNEREWMREKENKEMCNVGTSSPSPSSLLYFCVRKKKTVKERRRNGMNETENETSQRRSRLIHFFCSVSVVALLCSRDDKQYWTKKKKKCRQTKFIYKNHSFIHSFGRSFIPSCVVGVDSRVSFYIITNKYAFEQQIKKKKSERTKTIFISFDMITSRHSRKRDKREILRNIFAYELNLFYSAPCCYFFFFRFIFLCTFIYIPNNTCTCFHSNSINELSVFIYALLLLSIFMFYEFIFVLIDYSFFFCISLFFCVNCVNSKINIYKNINKFNRIISKIIKTISTYNNSKFKHRHRKWDALKPMPSQGDAWQLMHSSCKLVAKSTRKSTQKKQLCLPNSQGSALSDGRWVRLTVGRVKRIEFFFFTTNFVFIAQTMLDKEKKRFHEMAEKDKARYDLEMQNYVPPKGVVVGRGKKRKQQKDPNAPKRSL